MDREPEIAETMDRMLAAVRSSCAELGVDAYVVGGTLRDALLGIDVTELDLVANGDAGKLVDALRGRIGGTAVALDADRGVARLVPPVRGKAFQVDVATMLGASIEEDLARRDFTVNAMAAPILVFGTTGWQAAILDPLNGRADIENRCFRLASPSALRDDPSRLLRAVRLHVTRSLAPDDTLRAAVQRDAPLLATVSPERLQHELLLMLASTHAGAAVEELEALGLLMGLFPELEAGRDCVQPREHYWNVLEHSIHCVGYAAAVLAGAPPAEGQSLPWSRAVEEHLSEVLAHGHARSTFIKLACLLHDVAKPAAKTMEPNGRIRFLGHAELGASMTEAALRRLRFSAKASAYVASLVRHHLRPAQLAPKGKMPSRRAIWRYYRDVSDAAIGTLYLSLADYLAARGPKVEFQRWERHARIVQAILDGGDAEEPVHRAPRLLTGHDLIAKLGLPQGPTIGWLLSHISEATAVGEVTTKEEALELAHRLAGKAGAAR